MRGADARQCGDEQVDALAVDEPTDADDRDLAVDRQRRLERAKGAGDDGVGDDVDERRVE